MRTLLLPLADLRIRGRKSPNWVIPFPFHSEKILPPFVPSEFSLSLHLLSIYPQTKISDRAMLRTICSSSSPR